MEITGKIIQVLPMQTGAGRNGSDWKKQEFVIETTDQYPKKVCFSVWGDKIDQFNIQPGDDLTISITIESREYNGKWYTNVQAWKVDRVVAGGMPMEEEMPYPSAPAAAPQSAPFTSSSPIDDLPF